MSAVREDLPEGRYGRAQSADERTDHRLKVTGAVLGALFLAMIVWFGWSHVTSTTISGEMIKFDVSSATAAKVHLEVHKERDASGYCTVRALAEDGAEVGRKDALFDQDASRVDKVVSLRTTSQATAVELIGCSPA
ncbi:DUF4307 domain-containing protein [Streptomyces diastaticus]|uniref:DUF4307 domain-containing protein n=1 Tax=Streptomyces diastaticus TaxID=1956 RepID=UPI0013B8136E|nr:DUF4307 domain-containing protein [Streptomyces sp. SID8455]